MKPRDITIFTLIFVLCVVLTTEIVNFQLTGNHLFGGNKRTEVSLQKERCATGPIINRLPTDDPQLKALPEYEQACGSTFANDMMTFTNMPISEKNAEMYADLMTKRLKAFQVQGVTPIVIAEPDSDWGLVDFNEFASGNYDQWITAYFKRLRANGITDKTLGMWIPFPEPQQPFWNNNSNPDDFANSVNRYFGILRSVFPEGRTAILLDSQVGEEEQTSQLLAYTRLVDNNLVDVAGLQGFPWHPTGEGDERNPVTSADMFASADLLREVAKSLDTKEVLFNIGTYRHRKVENGGEIAITTAERKATLDSIVRQSNKLRADDYDVTVNIFAQNKFDKKEGVDWSYWEAGSYAKSVQTALFTDFVHDLIKGGAKISIYDSRE